MARVPALGIADITHAIFRIGIGLLFMQHALHNFGASGGGTPVAFLELGGAALVVLGFVTRPVALLLAAQMVAAYVVAPHLHPALFALSFVFLTGNGAGRLSIDAELRRHRRPAGGHLVLSELRKRAA